MPAGNESHLAIEIEPELRTRIVAAAAERGVSVRDYVVAALRQALASTGPERAADDSIEWSRLSSRSFARDWDSDADAVYDALA
ncbi:MAG: hypothetical protein H0U10_08995 [Chloroflexia bacterium]|nr:hypothetical protein [Chloroflexia bacterium]